MLPFLLIGAALLGGGFGVKKGVDGIGTGARADSVEKDATIRLEACRVRMAKHVKSGDAALRRLDRERAKARTLLTDDVATTLRRVAGVDDQGFAALESAMAFPDRLAVALGTCGSPLAPVASGAFSGLQAGMALSAAAKSGVTALGAASTGASISGLSGAAASKATLAWFGGGSLASGGFGMAGGAVALGSIVAAPAVLLGGLAFAKSAEQRLTRATGYAEEVSVAVEEAETVVVKAGAVKRRAEEVRKAVEEVARRVSALVPRIDGALDLIPPDGRGFDVLHPELQRRVMVLGTLAVLLSELAEVAIVDEAAHLLEGSGEVLARFRLLEEVESA